MKSFAHFGIAVCIAAQSLGAQEVDTKTIELRHLRPTEAVKLLKPYVKSKDGGVFDVSDNISIITLRDTPENITRMERVLAKYDHTPATIRLVFQLIEADTGPRLTSAANFQAPVSIDLDSTLRSVLRFPTYRLLAQNVATVGEFSYVLQEIAKPDFQGTYHLEANVGAIRLTDPAIATIANRALPGGQGTTTGGTGGTVHLTVSLVRDGTMTAGEASGRDPIRGVRDQAVISTGLDVPLGHTVVLGTAATRSSGAALILTVKPELVPSGH